MCRTLDELLRRMIICVKEEKERRKERNKQSKYSVVTFQMLSIQHNNN